MGKHLGFAVPASGLTFVQGDYEEERSNHRARNKRKSMDTSTPKQRKRSKTITENEPMEIQIEAVEASPLPFTCSLCQKNFSSKYLLKKHGKDCFEVTTETDETADNLTTGGNDLSKSESDSAPTGKGKCGKCTVEIF